MHDSSTLRGLSAILLLAALFAPATTFAARRRVVAPRLDVETLSIVFVTRTAGAHGAESLDLGTVSFHQQPRMRRPGWLTARDVVGVRIDRSSPSPAVGTATLRAWLPSPDPRSVVRIAGVRLTAFPQVIEPRQRIGTTASYMIEVDVKETADEGTILNGIEWDVVED